MWNLVENKTSYREIAMNTLGGTIASSILQLLCSGMVLNSVAAKSI